MNVKTFLTGIIALAAMTQGASAFPSTGDFRSVSSGDWTTVASWERYNGSAWVAAAAKPDATNYVTIQAGSPITVTSSEAADHLDVLDNLTISTNGTLTLDGSAKASSTIASGKAIILSTNTSVFSITTNNHGFSGAGAITGQNPSAVFQIGSNIKVTSQLLIQGMMSMQAASGSCTFENKRNSTANDEGVVLANANGTFTFASSVILDDTELVVSTVHYRPLYKADGSSSANAKLQFNRASDASDADHPRLVGRFEGAGGCATLEFLATVETEGSRVYTGNYGKIATNGAGAPVFRYDWVAGPSYTEISNCEAGSNCSCP